MKDLAFQITNELLNAGVIVEDVTPSTVQVVVESVLSPHFCQRIVHFTVSAGCRGEGEPICHQPGNVKMTEILSEVNCKRCLEMVQTESPLLERLRQRA